jgi:hypothetical protein
VSRAPPRIAYTPPRPADAPPARRRSSPARRAAVRPGAGAPRLRRGRSGSLGRPARCTGARHPPVGRRRRARRRRPRRAARRRLPVRGRLGARVRDRDAERAPVAARSGRGDLRARPRLLPRAPERHDPDPARRPLGRSLGTHARPGAVLRLEPRLRRPGRLRALPDVLRRDGAAPRLRPAAAGARPQPRPELAGAAAVRLDRGPRPRGGRPGPGLRRAGAAPRRAPVPSGDSGSRTARRRATPPISSAPKSPSSNGAASPSTSSASSRAGTATPTPAASSGTASGSRIRRDSWRSSSSETSA